MTNRRHLARWVSLSLFVVACSTNRGTTQEPPEGSPTGLDAGEPDAANEASDALVPDPDAPIPLVPREFTCDPTAVVADTPFTPLLLPSMTWSSDATALLRPSGAPCANDLVLVSASEQHVVSSRPGMIVLADAAAIGASLVVCLSNEQHSASRSSPDDRYSEAVTLECASHSALGWTPTVSVVPPDPSFAAWIVSVRPVEGSGDHAIVRWMRDSTFQFLHMVEDGRPATDGLYATELSVRDDSIVVEAVKKVGGPIYEVSGDPDIASP